MGRGPAAVQAGLRQGYLDRRRNHIYVFDVAEKKTVQITSGDYDDSSPVWSPDGTTIAFVSNRTDEPDSNYNTDVWLVDADNTDKGKTLVQVTQGPGSDISPAWHPDGSRILYRTTSVQDPRSATTSRRSWH